MADTAFGAMIDTAGALQQQQARRQQMELIQQQHEQQQAAAEAAQQRAVQYQTDIQSAFQSGDPKAFAQLALQYPEHSEKVGKSWQILDDANKQRAFGALTSAATLLNAGDAKGVQSVIASAPDVFGSIPQGMLQNPQTLKPLLFAQIGATGEQGIKFLDSLGQTAPQQLALRKQMSDEQKLAFDQKIEQRKIDLQERGVIVDEQKLQVDLQKAQNPDLSAGLQKLVDDSVTSSVASAGTASQMRSLASQVKQANWSGGSATQFNEWAKEVFGGEDAQTRLITQIEGVLSKEVLSNLPPGPATDKDVALARKAVMKSTANPAELSQALEAAARLQDKAASIQQAKADYISENGGLGKAKRDIVLSDGLTIPAGTAYSDVLKYAGKNASVIWENHPRLGRVTELDIESTMKANKMPRQQVIEMLRKVQ